MHSKLLLIAGPSGSGKTTLIKELKALDHRFVYISPYITRALREGETDKITVSDSELNRLWEAGELLVINELYGVKYGTPRTPIETALKTGAFPVVDWPINYVYKLAERFPDRVWTVYVRPPDRQSLIMRLTGRNNFDGRLALAEEELTQVDSHRFDHIIKCSVVSDQSTILESARHIYKCYLCSIDTTEGGI